MNAMKKLVLAVMMALVLGTYAGAAYADRDHGVGPTVETPGHFDSNIAQPNDD